MKARVVTPFLLLICTSLCFAEAVKITKGPFVEHAGRDSAVIAWSTNVSSASIVKFGTNERDLNRTAQMPWGGLTHRVTLKNLEPGRTYYFQADSSQGEGSGSAAVSQIGTFNTGGEGQGNRHDEPRAELKLTNGPAIEHVSDTTALIAWSTSLPSSSILRYGTNPNELNETREEPWGATTHRIELKNLRPRTRYFFSIHSAQGKDAPGQKIDTPPQEFTTR